MIHTASAIAMPAIIATEPNEEPPPSSLLLAGPVRPPLPAFASAPFFCSAWLVPVGSVVLTATPLGSITPAASCPLRFPSVATVASVPVVDVDVLDASPVVPFLKFVNVALRVVLARVSAGGVAAVLNVGAAEEAGVQRPCWEHIIHVSRHSSLVYQPRAFVSCEHKKARAKRKQTRPEACWLAAQRREHLVQFATAR